jgi:hypothetical protein
LRLEGLPLVAKQGRLLTSLELFMNLSNRFTSPSLATYLVPDVDIYLMYPCYVVDTKENSYQLLG